MACLAGVPAAAVLAFCTRNLSNAAALDEMISPSLTGQQLPGSSCASGAELGPAAADTAATAAASSAPFIAIAFDIAVSVAALSGARARALQSAGDPLGLAGVLGGGPMPATLSSLQRTVLQAIVTLSAGLQLPAPNAAGVTPDSAFGGQMRPWLAQLGAPAVDAWAVQLLLNGVAYYNLNGTNMLALRAAVAALPTAAPLAVAGEGGGSANSGLPIAVVAGGVGGVVVLAAALAAAVFTLRRRRRARARLAAGSTPSPRLAVSPLTAFSGTGKRGGPPSGGDTLRANPLLHALSGSASAGADLSAAKTAPGTPSSRIAVNSLASAAVGGSGRARARIADGAGLTVNPLHKAAAGPASAADAALAAASGSNAQRITFSPLAGAGSARELAAARSADAASGDMNPMHKPAEGQGPGVDRAASTDGVVDERTVLRKSALATFFTPKSAANDRHSSEPQPATELDEVDNGRAAKARGKALMHKPSVRVGFGGEVAKGGREKAAKEDSARGRSDLSGGDDGSGGGADSSEPSIA